MKDFFVLMLFIFSFSYSTMAHELSGSSVKNVVSENKEFRQFPIKTVDSRDTVSNNNRDSLNSSLDSYVQENHLYEKWRNPIYLTPVFRSSILQAPQLKSIFSHTSSSELPSYLVFPKELSYIPTINNYRYLDSIRRVYLLKNINDVHYSDADLSSYEKLNRNANKKLNPSLEFLPSISNVDFAMPTTIKKKDVERRYWVFSGAHQLQISQNFISPNWYKGGNSNFMIKSNQLIAAKYNKDNLSSDLAVESRLGLLKTEENTISHFMIREDLLKLTADFGLKAYKSLSYLLNMEVKTQLFNNISYKKNKKTNDPEDLIAVRNSSFLSPLYVNVGFGLKYNYKWESKKVRGRKMDFQFSFSPFSSNLKYVRDRKVALDRFGIKNAQKRYIIAYGSSLALSLNYSVTKYCLLTSKLKCFSNYKTMELDFENTLDFALSHLLSTQINVNTRFDNSVKKIDPQYGYWQLYELISFGLSYKW